MSGRFSLSATPEEVRRHFDLESIADFPPRYNIAPAQPVLLIEIDADWNPGRSCRNATLARWGLIPQWVKDVAAFPLLTSARAESVAHKASFRGALRHHRVLVPASGFYDWKQLGKAKQAYFIKPAQGGLLALAGLKETYLSADGSEIDTMALITTPAAPALSAISERMPVIIDPGDFGPWLDCKSHEPAQIAVLMRPPLSCELLAVPVSSKVNTVSNTGADIQDPVNLNESGDVQATKSVNISTDPAQFKLF